MPEGSTSLSLLKRVRERNPEAWDRLVFLYAPLVHHWCQSWGMQGADADDVRQEVFQAVSRHVEQFRRDRAGDSFRGWLRVIARRKFLDHCRRENVQPQAQGGSDANLLLQNIPDEVIRDDDDPPQQVQSLHHRALELVRSQFEEKTWQAFWRCAVEGQSPLEVGEAMHMSPAAVRKAKSRVLHRLKQELGELLG
ncbi:MAG: sigma-70 family RNA polymerase sigma factor [Planctomycetia bacterium]|nr:sigma-70 family RNA polymerase sigma factor [Planctomycetia bacterium]